jgi:hypothetical protein
MQKGSLIRSSRRQGPDVWKYRWKESSSGAKRKHRRIVIGSLEILRDESAAPKAIAALRRDININDARLRAKPLTLAELKEASLFRSAAQSRTACNSQNRAPRIRTRR